MSSTSKAVESPSTGENISIELPAPKKNRALQLLGLMFWLLLVYVVGQLVQAYINNQYIISWWQKGTGPDKKYNKYFSIWLVVLHQNASGLLESIVRLFLPGEARMSGAMLTFVSERLLPFIRVTDPSNKQSGILIPRHIGDGILLQYSDNDVSFQTWCDTNSDTRVWNKDDALDPDYLMKWEKVNAENQTLQFSMKACPKCDGKIGIYPDATDRYGWMCCIQYWMNGKTNTPNWRWTPSSDTPPIYFMHADDETKDPEWWDIDMHPDNVFARYGIDYNSPIIIYYANGKFADGSLPVDAAALQNLMQGGWARFLYDFGPDKSVDDIYNQISTKVNKEVAPAAAQPSCASSRASAGLTTLATLVASLGPLAFTGVDPYVVIPLVILAVAASGTQQGIALGSKGCLG